MAEPCVSNGTLGNLYCSIGAALSTVTGIGSIGKWNGQHLNDENEHQFNYPAVFIEFSSIEWMPTDLNPAKSINKQQQKGNVEVTLHICYKEIKTSSESFGDHIQFTKDIWDKINMLRGQYFTPLQRLRETDDVDHDIIRDWQQTYSTMVTEAPVVSNLEDAAPVTVTLTTTLNYD